jgi:DNA-binding transcriptional LysR family regulator
MSASIDFRRLHHLVLLSEELNFSRAALRASLSQTAFSRSIQSIEADFGLRLFDRGTRSVQPTAAGRHMAERARELLARARDFAQEIDYLANAEGGSLSFGASLFAVDTVLPGVLPKLVRQRPGLQINVEVSQWKILLQHLEDERIEFFVAYTGLLGADPRYTVTELPPQAASLYCRAGHPLLSQPRLPPAPAQVPLYPWAAVRLDKEVGLHLRGLFAMAPDSELPIKLSCDNQALLRETVLGSDTLLLTWQAWLRKDLADGNLVDLGARLRPKVPAQAMWLRLGLVHLAKRTLSPAARTLIAMINEELDSS